MRQKNLFGGYFLNKGMSRTGIELGQKFMLFAQPDPIWQKIKNGEMPNIFLRSTWGSGCHYL